MDAPVSNLDKDGSPDFREEPSSTRERIEHDWYDALPRDYQPHEYPVCSNPMCQDNPKFVPGEHCEHSDFSHMCGARATHRTKCMNLTSGEYCSGFYCEQHCLIVNHNWIVVECVRLQYDPATVFAVLTQLDILFKLCGRPCFFCGFDTASSDCCFAAEDETLEW